MLYSHQEESIFIQIDQNTYDEMINEGLLWPQIETGGMLFGNIIEEEQNLVIKIQRTYIPSSEDCIREAAYFEIEPEFAKMILSQESLKYLGNWHKHPGYGGPSQGDRRQIQDFFGNNPHLDFVLTFILNFHSDAFIEPIIETYFRTDENLNSGHSFLTRYIPQSNLIFIPSQLDEPKPIIQTSGIPNALISRIKQELVNLFDHLSSIEEIQEFPGQTPDEKVISFPYTVLIQQEKVNILILISFPPEFPKGKIYFDISSEDMSKDITFKTHPAETLTDLELVSPFLEVLKSDIEHDIPVLLEKPLWRVMREKL